MNQPSRGHLAYPSCLLTLGVRARLSAAGTPRCHSLILLVMVPVFVAAPCFPCTVSDAVNWVATLPIIAFLWLQSHVAPWASDPKFILFGGEVACSQGQRHNGGRSESTESAVRAEPMMSASPWLRVSFKMKCHPPGNYHDHIFKVLKYLKPCQAVCSSLNQRHNLDWD